MDYIEFEEVEIVAVSHSGLARLVRFDNEDELWIPKSCFEDNPGDVTEKGETGRVFISEWFCQKEDIG